MVNPGRITSPKLLAGLRRFLGLLVAVYLFFILGSAVYRNYLVKSRIDQLEEDIAVLKKETQRLGNLITYYQSATFRELEARKKLGLKKPGETVIALPENSDEAPAEEESEGTTPDRTKSNYLKWWEYLFGLGGVTSFPLPTRSRAKPALAGKLAPPLPR